MNKDANDYDAQIEKMMAHVTVEKAPASLSARLHRIPEEESRKQRTRRNRWSWLGNGPLPKWALAPVIAAVPLVALIVVLMQPKQPTKAEVEQARHDLAVAFTYLDKVGALTGSEIQSVLGSELRHIVKDPLSKHMPFTEHSLKEEST